VVAALVLDDPVAGLVAWLHGVFEDAGRLATADVAPVGETVGSAAARTLRAAADRRAREEKATILKGVAAEF
jgi:hypothetical protein